MNSAKNTVSSASYTYAMADANTSGAVKSLVEKTIGGLDLNGVSATVTLNSFSAATSNTPGQFGATVSLSKGTSRGTAAISGTITAAGTPTESGSTGNTVQVTFRLVGSTLSSGDVDLSTNSYKSAGYVTWIKTESYTLPKDSTMVNGPIKAAKGTYPQSEPILKSAQLPTLIPKTQLTIGILIAVAAIVVYAVFWKKTALGYEMEMVGSSEQVARYAGIPVDRLVVWSMQNICYLSGGNQQKAVVARELDKNPKLLLAVYPTRGVDIGAVDFIHKEIVKARDSGCAVLLVSSELDEILVLSDRIGVIYDGTILGEMDREDATIEKIGMALLDKDAREREESADANGSTLCKP